ncbi:radical SAM protein [Streptomyces sp. CA-243310]|uniref:radical SAM protein n=1 Tax=Streptomyces sp. CA-243310 TaxID=3240056 RepID=UPI003D94256E
MSTTAIEHAIESVECELTAKCNLTCDHCCTNSSPQAAAPTMTPEDWHRVINDTASLGIPTIQFIGGEATLDRHLPDYIGHARERRLRVEVFSNLKIVQPRMWRAFQQSGVQLAVSYYSDQAEQHDAVTNGPGSHKLTRANIIKALAYGIPMRAAVVMVNEGQRVKEAADDLRSLGISRIRIDRTRKVGRAADQTLDTPSVSELCGHCFRARISVSPDGNVNGCILSPWLIAGNVREQGLANVLRGPRVAELAATIPMPVHGQGCPPDDSSDCSPANTTACDPKYDFAPLADTALGARA